MANAKVKLKVDRIEFRCEGEDVWVATQLDKILNWFPYQCPASRIYEPIHKNIKISVSNKNVVDQPCDLLILKHAQKFFGADLTISQFLSDSGIPLEDMQVKNGEFRLIPSHNVIAARQTLFVGVGPLGEFGYEQVRNFSELALNIAANEVPNANHIAMTIHGVGYGLEERESFTSQLSGLFVAIHNRTIPLGLEQITIVEYNQDRSTRLKRILSEYLAVSNTHVSDK